MIGSADTTPELDILVGPFYGTPARLADFEEITADEMPAPYRELLVHDRHMTVTLEAFYGCPVQLQLLHRHVNETHYARNTLLRRSSDGSLVQFGIARLAFSCLPDRVRSEIEQARTPLGRILIQNHILRRVQVRSLWRLLPGPQLTQIFATESPQATYARSAWIFFEGEPALEVLEVMPPGLPRPTDA